MSAPQPFRSVRPTGPSSTGGSVHTLAAHMASGNAHPQYVKKGDEVGNSNLTAHELDPNAHVIHYLKRSELASVIGDFEASCNTQVDYSKLAENGDYKHVVSSFLLKTILSNADAVKSYFTAVSRTADVVTNFSTAISNPRPVDDYRVPHWDVFGTLRDIVGSMLAGGENSLDEGNPFYLSSSGNPANNPLANIFALKIHSHDNYAAKKHYHDFSDIRDSNDPDSGVIAARSDHNHDNVYARLDDLESLGITFDPDSLRRVGIWETAVASPSITLGTEDQEDDEISYSFNLNLYTEQGNYNFKLSKEAVESNNFESDVINFPSEYLTAVRRGYLTSSEDSENPQTAMVSLSRTFEAIATLTVVSTTNRPIDFSTDNLSDYFCNMTRSMTYKVVNQVLYTDSPLNRVSDDDVDEYSSVNDYKDFVRSSYTRTGYSFESAWYISSVLDIILGLTPKEFIVNVEGNPIKNISELVNAAYEDNEDRSGLVVGFCKAPYTDEDDTSGNLVRLSEELIGLENSIFNISDVTLSNEESERYMNKYSGIKDICFWLIPGLKNRHGDDGHEYTPCESLMTSNQNVYIPYLQYHELKNIYVELEAAELDEPIDTSEVYYDSENGEIALSDGINALSSSTITEGEYDSEDRDIVGSDANGYPGVVNNEVYGWVLQNFVKVEINSFETGVEYFTKSSSADSSTKSYNFTKANSYEQDTEYYVLKPVVDSDSSYLWSKALIIRGEEYNSSSRYFVYDVKSSTFVDISYELSNTYSGVIAVNGTIPSSGLGNYDTCPIFTDRVIKRANREISPIRPVPDQYVAPIVDEIVAKEGETYVHIYASISTISGAKVLQSEFPDISLTTGLTRQNNEITPVVFIISEDSEYPIMFGDTEVDEESLLPIVKYKNVHVVSLSYVGLGEEPDSDYRYVGISEEDGSVQYFESQPTTTEELDVLVSNSAYSHVVKIPADTEDDEYVIPGESLSSSVANEAYCLKLPRYFELVSDKLNAKSDVLVNAFFFNTKDISRIEGKSYFKRSGDVFSEIHFNAGENLSDYATDISSEIYERIDMETMFDIYCAILQLTSSGSEAIDTTTYGNSLTNIVYNLGKDGHLVAWDNWQKYVTDANPSFVEYVVRQNEIIELVDDVLPALKDGLAHAGYDTDGSYNYANGVLRLFKIVSWLNDANTGAEDSVIATRFNLLFGISTEVTRESFTERNSDNPTSSSTEVSTKTNIDVTRLKYGDSVLSNLDDLKRKAGVAWVKNIEDRLVAQEDLNLAAIRTWLFGDTTSAIPAVSTSIDSRLTDLETFSAWARTVITNATGSGGGGLIINSTVTDYDIGPFLANASAQDVVNLNGTVQYNGSDYSILGISENGYTPYQFSIVLKTDVGAGAEYEVIENPVAEVLVHRANTGTVKGAIYVPASSLLWIIVTGANHGVYFRVPDSWVDLYDIRTNSGVADGVSPNIKVCLRVRYFGNSSSGIGKILSGV